MVAFICDEPKDHLVSLCHFLDMGPHLCRPQSSLLNFNINERSTIEMHTYQIIRDRGLHGVRVSPNTLWGDFRETEAHKRIHFQEKGVKMCKIVVFNFGFVNLIL